MSRRLLAFNAVDHPAGAETTHPDALAAAVLEVLSRRAELGAAAHEHARRFHTSRYVDQVERLLR